MRKTTIRVAFGFLVVLCISCKEKSTNPETQTPISFSSQYSKCLSYGLAKASGFDSIFTYTFVDSLEVNFSVKANCCPDSNRFMVTQRISTDTLIISVVDTARSLCNCICVYMIHASFGNLPEGNYVVRCRIGNSQGYDDPIHLVNVNRKR